MISSLKNLVVRGVAFLSRNASRNFFNVEEEEDEHEEEEKKKFKIKHKDLLIDFDSLACYQN